MNAEVHDLKELKILVVDDEDDVRDVAQMCLGLLGGANVICASNGPEGVELAETEKPDLIVLDVMMPDVDGSETIRRLRDNPETSHIPVIFLTVKGIPSEIARLKGLGALAVLQKPFEPERLAKQIHDILNPTSRAAQ